MSHEFRLQDPGEGIHEAEILEINVSKGDHVKEGDDVIVAETDKAAVDIPAPISGNVQEIRVSVGDIVKVGDVLMVFGDEDGESSEQSDDTQETEDQSQSEPEEVDVNDNEDSDTADEDAVDTDHQQNSDSNDRGQDPDEDTSAEREGQSAEEDRDASGADDETAKPEDIDDRVNVDAESEDTGESEEEKSESEEKTSSAERDKIDDSDVRATPAVRGLAHELNVNLATVEGSGDEGRILEDDVREAADQQEASDKGDDGKAESDDSETVVKLRTLRRTTARRMEQAWRDIPHVTHHDVIEITALERLRQEHAAEIEERGGTLTLTPFIVKALVIALADFPNFNATFDVEERAVHCKKRIDVGVAFDTERGLIVPVLRNAGQASIAELALQLSEFDERLRKGNATAEDLRGATFTLTNIGAIGGTGLTPIINPPQTAIFGAARAELRQVVRGDLDDHTTDVALCLPVCLTFDHRVADGAEAARFVNSVRALLADPGRLMLHS